ncbi:MAG: hypothetical protein PHE59_00355 [Patescibacteria group bacterium]|nr:hypothetical protein [Patescibacteria group bacterium]MDD5164305.1 hypothetical protein [Patescibacteria group bacterium]MDD5534751.1 hypothetical protein [Patescibacteria group bacterium]
MSINLLPEEMREDEKINKKTEESAEIKFSQPIKEKNSVPLKTAEPKIGWFNFKKQSAESKESPISNLKIVDTSTPFSINPEPAERIEPEVSQNDKKEKMSELAELLIQEEPKKESEKKPEIIRPVADKPRDKKFLTETSQTPEITLMPGQEMIIPRIVKEKMLILSATIIVVITVFSIVLLYTNWHFEQLRVEKRKLQVDSQLWEAKTYPLLKVRNDVASLEKKAMKVEEILANHVYWTRFFSLLETYTIPDVYFGDFSADTSGAVHLSATAKDLISVARQIIVFNNATDFIKNAQATNISRTPSGIVTFSVDLILVDGVFKQ